MLQQRKSRAWIELQKDSDVPSGATVREVYLSAEEPGQLEEAKRLIGNIVKEANSRRQGGGGGGKGKGAGKGKGKGGGKGGRCGRR